ncbi:MAG: hypothetical protein OZSIB_2578 [Candidatus Ozemobacter sibiricus]|uniref:Uncharacterized protein n=1 Tax=Candidatus Ozemobacter sibiricus TaxID=2268124 RepID=A0A367ZJA5_9BACT|nr:MAG: hypothetical protein OZSIB_2578 [Candidatus Ozemobacter sibiricus]
MGCLRWLVASGLLMAGAVCGLVLLAGQMMGGPLDRLLEIAQSAPTRSLAQALATDGEAWIKVRFELASGAAPLLGAGQPCLYVQIAEYRTDVDDIRVGGTWTRRLVERPATESKRFTAFDLVDGATRLTIDDPLGVKVWPDLLQERREIIWPGEAAAASASLGTGGQAETQTGGQAGGAPPSDAGLVEGRIRRVEAWLPIGAEGWVLGRFVGGRPQVLDNGMFVLTSLGPERFGRTMAEARTQRRAIQTACVIGLLLFPLLAIYLVLKRR